MNRTAIAYGALLGGLGVALGAFGAHALRDALSAHQLANFETGVRYQMYHALALLGIGAAGFSTRAATLLLVGTVIFSLSLYILAISGVGILGAITPIGGVLQIVGWGMVCFEALRRR
ncbi:uncharacterized membrane protein YgdD (TMEM256/DUF423 family) [Deinobacterium chartae]|uniref:Uncharacterized membrane protein YgdD (TMEM256/DUF423 family) n=1 Tax=Deinobacterium chartae TaxID=521158 RepID=A0A841HVR4_9DEIO|nr:DUF423 domain-containing protein [Deinobacterium chartae]MBB6097006.1 uncharacterized membrane protein YgdD (TMEM256/DUF423 family) [Deinobacterium chartae]